MTYLQIDVFDERRLRDVEDDNWGVRMTEVPEASIESGLQIIIDKRVDPEDAVELMTRALEMLQACTKEDQR